MTLYKLIDHTADLGIEVMGRTRGELFAKAALSLMDILVEKKGTPSGVKEKALFVEGSDPADLLVNFLREILYLVNGEALIVATCEMTACGHKQLAATLLLEPYDQKKHVMKTEIKAVTYHGLAVEKTKTGWKARVIFDV